MWAWSVYEHNGTALTDVQMVLALLCASSKKRSKIASHTNVPGKYKTSSVYAPHIRCIARCEHIAILLSTTNVNCEDQIIRTIYCALWSFVVKFFTQVKAKRICKHDRRTKHTKTKVNKEQKRKIFGAAKTAAMPHSPYWMWHIQLLAVCGTQKIYNASCNTHNGSDWRRRQEAVFSIWKCVWIFLLTETQNRHAHTHIYWADNTVSVAALTTSMRRSHTHSPPNKHSHAQVKHQLRINMYVDI